MSSSKSLHLSLGQMIRPCFNIAVIGISSIVFLSGCQTTKGLLGKVEDGSLEYQKASQLEPLKLPAEQNTAPFTPLYPLPNATPNTLELENDSGKRFELPPPYRKEITQ